MKLLKFLPVLGLLALVTSCSSVRVNTDYDQSVNFGQYRTYAFLKEGVDEMKISDLDKKRIMKAVDVEMSKKGFVKSENPDLLINLFTDAQKNVHINNWGWGRPWGWGWGYPMMWGGMGMWGGSTVSTSTEGILYIDIVRASNKELIWQGQGSGFLSKKRERKEAKIQEFAQKVLADFPPQPKK